MSSRVARFEWDEENVRHLALHGVFAGEVEEAFLDAFQLLLGRTEHEGEARFSMVAGTFGGRVLVIVFTHCRRAIQAITAYPAKGGVLRRYEERRQHGR